MNKCGFISNHFFDDAIVVTKCRLSGLLLGILLLAAVPGIAQAAKQGKAFFKANCQACHQPSTAQVGPSLYEIAKIYEKNMSGIVSWAMQPGRKRKQGIAMPAMAFLGEQKLSQIATYMLNVGAKANKVKKKKPIFEEKLGVVQRTFMPESSPASIAVSLPNGISFCFDTDNNYLRYFWQGVLVPGAQFGGNGAALPTLSSAAFHTVAKQPFLGQFSERAFLGYDLNDTGLPEFRYQLGEFEINEYLEPSSDGFFWHYTIKGDGVLKYNLPQIKGYSVSVDEGKVDAGVLTVELAVNKAFVIKITKTN